MRIWKNVGLIVLAGGLLISSSQNAWLQEGAKQLDKLGPQPKDQRNEEAKGRKQLLPVIQKDVYAFAREGERTLKLDPRIIGGTPAPIGAYPWQVSIGLRNVPASIGHFCGGSVIARNWVLTAAHCVDGSTKPTSITVFFGTNILSESRQSTAVEEIILHEQWDASSFDNDVALLRTKDVMDVVPIKLIGPNNEEKLVPVGVLGTVSGWGLTSVGGSTSDVLQHVGVQVVSNQSCNGPAAYAGSITDQMICAGFAVGGKDSCQGDSGGPFVVFDQKGGFSLAGIVSWGEGCAAPNKYGVYTRVSKIYNWVKENIEK